MNETRHRYNTDPEFAQQVDEKVDLSTARVSLSDVGGREVTTRQLLEIAHEFWLLGEVHLFEEIDGSRVHLLPPERVVEIDGRSFLLMLEDRSPPLHFPLHDSLYTKLTREGEDPSAFVEALRENWPPKLEALSEKALDLGPVAPV